MTPPKHHNAPGCRGVHFGNRRNNLYGFKYRYLFLTLYFYIYVCQNQFIFKFVLKYKLNLCRVVIFDFDWRRDKKKTVTRFLSD